MKSIKIKTQSFKMEDFEKGLMLAGFITPVSALEFYERELLDEYENENQSVESSNKNVFFKRVTLAAEIAFCLHEEQTFGRVKFQKLVYLCEHVAQMNLQERYTKQAAGPFDNKFMHSIESQFKKNGWFEVEKILDGKYTRSIYKPLENAEGFKKYYNAYFKDSIDSITYIIETFRKSKTDFTEVVATLYACSIELKSQNIAFNEDNLLQKFYSWSKEKGRFNDRYVLDTWKWMNENGIVPDLF